MKEPIYKIAEIVYLITDMDQQPRIVTDRIWYDSIRQWRYIISSGLISTEHQEFEIDKEKRFGI